MYNRSRKHPNHNSVGVSLGFPDTIFHPPSLLPPPLFHSLLCALLHHRLRNRSWPGVWVFCYCNVTRSPVTKCFNQIFLPSLKPVLSSSLHSLTQETKQLILVRLRNGNYRRTNQTLSGHCSVIYRKWSKTSSNTSNQYFGKNLGEKIIKDVIKCVWLYEVWDCSCWEWWREITISGDFTSQLSYFNLFWFSEKIWPQIYGCANSNTDTAWIICSNCFVFVLFFRLHDIMTKYSFRNCFSDKSTWFKKKKNKNQALMSIVKANIMHINMLMQC